MRSAVDELGNDRPAAAAATSLKTKAYLISEQPCRTAVSISVRVGGLPSGTRRVPR